MARTGRPPIGPYMAARVEPELDELIRRRADERGEPLAAIVRELLHAGVEATDAEEPVNA